MAEKLTPMMQQYFEVKRGLPKDTLLLFRLGDFFEMFFDDAVIASRLLGITLTKRQRHPMAGIPPTGADNYVTKLLAAGKKVAICDQAEPAKAGKLVRDSSRASSRPAPRSPPTSSTPRATTTSAPSRSTNRPPRRLAGPLHR
jgi:DNA mismatch repair ATPase MutS